VLTGVRTGACGAIAATASSTLWALTALPLPVTIGREVSFVAAGPATVVDRALASRRVRLLAPNMGSSNSPILSICREFLYLDKWWTKY